LAVAAAEGHRVPEKARAIARDSLVDPASQVKASMLRDLEAGGPVEAAHIVGDMWHRARAAGLDTPLLQAAWVHLQAYQARRQHRARARTASHRAGPVARVVYPAPVRQRRPQRMQKGALPAIALALALALCACGGSAPGPTDTDATNATDATRRAADAAPGP